MARPASANGSSSVGFLFGFVAALLVGGMAIWLIRGTLWGTTRIDTSRPSVVRQIRELRRLETVVFGMDKIVGGGWDSRFLPKMIAGDRLLLMVYGEVTAGIDLGRVDASNVTVSGRTISLQLPEPEIFSTRVDNERTRVFSRQTGLFTTVDPNLESDVRREGERQVQQAALDSGILRLASTNAHTTMTAFLQGLGFERAEIR